MKEIICYSVWDKKAKLFDTPFFAMSDLFARRHLIILVKNKNAMIELFLEDFDLFRIGSFNTDDGKFKAIEPKLITNAGNLISDYEKERS